jgi:hypothetical protein
LQNLAAAEFKPGAVLCFGVLVGNEHALLYNDNVLDMGNSSETNWAMIDSLTDETIDRSELSPLDDSFFDKATWRMSEGQAIVTVFWVACPFCPSLAIAPLG